MEVKIDTGSSTPPFEQLRSQLARQVADGTLPAGTRLPTVRSLAGQLGLATNTVARAYKELEADRVVRTEGRRGTFVKPRSVVAGAVSESAASLVVAARQSGLTLAETLRLVEDAWS